MSVLRLRIAVGVVALGFVLALVLGSAGLLGGGRALGASTTITVIGGDVSVRHGPNASFVAAVDGEVLDPGAAVRTAADARAVLTYFEGSTVTIEPNTELVIDAAASHGSDTIVQMTQNVGRTWHTVTKLVTGGSKYEVKTPASTASVRGTAFTVDTDGSTTTITTTEGTVVDAVPDPARPGTVVEVPVPAGQQHAQVRDAPPAPPHPAPPAARTVTVTVTASNSLVVDPFGRANGVTPDGRIVVQTPGAKVRREGASIVIVLPDLPDGALATRVDRSKAGSDDDVKVHAVIEDKDGNRAEVDDNVKAGADKKAVSGITIVKDSNGKIETRTLDDAAKKDLKTDKVGEPPKGPTGDDKTASPEQTATRKPASSGTARPDGNGSDSGDSSAPPSGSGSPRTSEPRTDQPRTDAPRTEQPRTDQPRTDQHTDQPRPDQTHTPKASQSSGVLPSFALPSLPGTDPQPTPSPTASPTANPTASPSSRNPTHTPKPSKSPDSGTE